MANVCSTISTQRPPLPLRSFRDHCHLYYEAYKSYFDEQSQDLRSESTHVPPAPLVSFPKTHSRTPHRQLHSWYDTDHGSAVLDWCHSRHINTHPQRCKPRGPAPSRSLRLARECSNKLKFHLFQTCLRSTAGHSLSQLPHYGRSSKPTTASASRRRRRYLLTGQSGSRIRHLQRTSPPTTLCQVGGSSIFRSHLPNPPVPVPQQAEIIADLLQAENVSTSSLLGGLNTWITAPVDEFPDLYPIYVALIERISGEETKGETQYTQLSSGEFRRLSPTRQIAEFRTLGVDAHTDQEVLKILLGSAPPNTRRKLRPPHGVSNRTTITGHTSSRTPPRETHTACCGASWRSHSTSLPTYPLPK